MASADGEGPASTRGTPRDEEARAALTDNLARQREVALGKRVVNTQGRDSIAFADELQTADGDATGWMA